MKQATRLLNRWQALLILLFVLQGLVVASVLPPWSGEDEPSHFGYIEALGRENRWYMFWDNLASLEYRMAHRWWDAAEERRDVVGFFSQNHQVDYRDYASDHMNATAYQPALFYWLMSRLYRVLDSWNIFSVLYFFRYLNVLIGAVFLWVSLSIGTRLFTRAEDYILYGAFIGFLPMLSLLSGSTTVQVSVFLGFAIFLLSLIKAQYQPKWYVVAVMTAVLGVVTQQVFWSLPFVLFIVLSYAFWHEPAQRGIILLSGVMLLIGVSIVLPTLRQRDADTMYTNTGADFQVRRATMLTYLPLSWDRIKEETIDSFFDQRRSMIPYYSSENFERLGLILVFLASSGFLYGLYVHRRQIVKSREKRWIFLVFGVTSAAVIVGHLVFDYIQFLYSSQEYTKARYYYPLLPIIAAGFVWGLRQNPLLSKTSQPFLSILTLLTLVVLQYTAIAWLVLHT